MLKHPIVSVCQHLIVPPLHVCYISLTSQYAEQNKVANQKPLLFFTSSWFILLYNLQMPTSDTYLRACSTVFDS